MDLKAALATGALALSGESMSLVRPRLPEFDAIDGAQRKGTLNPNEEGLNRSAALCRPMNQRLKQS